MKLDLIYNPVAGSFRARRLDALVRAFERRGASVTALPTTREGVRLSGSAELVCVHGGDGTLRDTVQALGSRAGEVPLCIAPAGTINLVARELGYPRDPDRLAALVCAAWERGPDAWTRAPLYTLGEMPVVACLSIGPDSHAVAHVSGALKRRIGRLAYVVAMLQVLRDWPRETMTITGELADGTAFECEAAAVIVSHGALFAGISRVGGIAGQIGHCHHRITSLGAQPHDRFPSVTGRFSLLFHPPPGVERQRRVDAWYRGYRVPE